MRVHVITLTCLCLLPAIFGDTEKNGTTFVPTREWQIVKKGTLIPGGLHVRHNFQTGVTEAKLMDNEETEEKDSKEDSNHLQSNSLTLHPEKAVNEEQEPPMTTEKSDLFEYPIKELKARLKNIKQDYSAENDDRVQQIKEKFRDYETLKKELKGLEINITTDSELLTNYFQNFQTHKNAIGLGTLTVAETEEVLDILHNLEFLLHHIDNAKMFTEMQGMSKIISPCLNGTNNEIKAEALRLLGAAVQSNPKVQIKALENDFVQKLLHILSTNTKVEVRSRCLFALSALIRQFPAAQKVWIDHGGVEIFGKILLDDQLQLQMKVMKLINDLITERQNLQEVTDADQRQLKTKAYAAADIEQKLLAYEYCKHLNNLITKNFKHELGSEFRTENYEFLEVVSDSMITVASVCEDQFKRNKETLLPVIQHLLKFYENIKDLNLLMEKLQTTDSESPRDEL